MLLKAGFLALLHQHPWKAQNLLLKTSEKSQRNSTAGRALTLYLVNPGSIPYIHPIWPL